MQIVFAPKKTYSQLLVSRLSKRRVRVVPKLPKWGEFAIARPDASGSANLSSTETIGVCLKIWFFRMRLTPETKIKLIALGRTAAKELRKIGSQRSVRMS